MQMVTLRDLARLTSYSLGTISMALRNDHRVAAATRKVIQAEAAKQGYRPEPLVRDFMSRVRHGDGAKHEVMIAYVIPWTSREAHYVYPSFRQFYKGAQSRATEGGYRLEEFLLTETGLRGRILKARGFAGVVLAPTTDSDPAASQADFDFCASATLGYSVENPVLSRAVHDHAGGLERILVELVARNHRRIGLVVGEIINRRVRGRWLGPFLSARDGAQAKHLLPPLILPLHQETKALDAWLKQYRPDAVITTEWDLARDRLARVGACIPDDTSLIHLEWNPDLPGGAAGIDQRSEMVGSAAVDIVIGQIVRHERGEPEVRRTLLIEGRWVDGPTVRPKA